MGFGTIIASASWMLVLFFLDPQSGVAGLALFFTSFSLTVFGIASLLGFFVRRLFQRKEPAFRLVAISFRQAALIALLLTAALFLQSHQLFTAWTALLLLFFVSLIEAFFAARTAAQQSQRGGTRGA